MNTPIGGFEKLKTVFFIGIGGIGMSALARYFNWKEVKVSGYDKTPSLLTRELEEEGIAVHYEDDVALAPKNAELVVYTPAVPKDHRQLAFYQENGYRVLKRSDVLEEITKSSFNICVAGTHGKTTISTMIAHLLRDSGYGCNAFLGGISVNYGTNFWGSKKNVMVVEADEYDRSFLKLKPDVAVITAMDADHLDIYGSTEKMEEAFIEFSCLVKADGMLLSRSGLKRDSELGKGLDHFIRRNTYSLEEGRSNAHSTALEIKNGSYVFDYVNGEKRIDRLVLHMGGMHNVENAVAAITVASSLEIEDERIRMALTSFKGVRRRFEYIIKNERQVFIDDYAHHPEELRALISGAKSLFSNRRCTVIFQPHLFSRTRDLANGFAEALDLADEIVLLPIYPAREIPIEGVSSELILEKMKQKNKQILEKEPLMKWMSDEYAKRNEGAILITAGAGDIDRLVQPFSEILNNEES